MTSIDLKDALYLVPLYENHQPYLIFFAEKYLNLSIWLQTSYENIYKSSQRNRFFGLIFVDDSYLMIAMRDASLIF